MKGMGASHFLNIEFFNSVKVADEPKIKNLPFAESPLYYAPIKSSKLLSKGEDTNKIYELILNTQDIDFEFEVGDTIGILPCNSAYEIEQIIEKLKLKEVADKFYKLSVSRDTSKKNPKIPQHIPEYGTIRNILQYHIDIRSPPKKLFLQTLSSYTKAEEERKNIIFLCSKEGSTKYTEFISNNIGLLDLLNKYPSCCPPITAVLEHLPSLQPRPYSISSSPLIENQLHITFSVITFDNGRKGVCTGWLESLIISDSENIETKFGSLSLNNSSIVKELVPFYFRKPKMRFPKDPSTPIIMIGPGTGVAPFVGFLQTRLLQKVNGLTWLFFGCKYCDKDFIFKQQLHDFKEKGTLTKLFTCFSREDDSNKKYVQDLIMENGKEFVELVDKDGAVVYVCGDVKNMMKDVKCAIIKCFVKFKKDFNDDEEKASKFVKSLQDSFRYVEDSWI
ncbi:methionine synthase reductase [Agrilus planipennis]|uniref:Methionine synthase reductase n=1 Tax=Agrilus planipennis TaxID=224129 RepID=A0A1W4WUQ3_AGRPL|nr:methionine synthase reductase [Agrilus planipennis]